MHDEQWDPADVQRLAQGWLALLTDAVADPAKPVGLLSLGVRGDGAEDAEPPTATAWCTSGSPRPPGHTPTGSRSPPPTTRSPAANWTSGRTTGAAAALVGAGPDRLVALCMQRSCAQIVAALGILKSGAGYLPLDPGHP